MATRNSTAVYPFLAIFCAALVLLSIAAMIVLGLIPIYLPRKTVTLASVYTYQTTETYSIDVSDNSSTGNLSDSEQAQLTEYLQSSLNDATKSSGTVSVQSAEVVAGSSSVGDRKRRQVSSKVLVLVILITGRTRGVLNIIGNLVKSFIQSNAPDITVLVESIINSATTIISPSIISTTTLSASIISTTTVSPSIISTTTIPSGMLSSTVGGRRRRHQKYDWSSISPPVTYKD